MGSYRGMSGFWNDYCTYNEEEEEIEKKNNNKKRK